LGYERTGNLVIEQEKKNVAALASNTERGITLQKAFQTDHNRGSGTDEN